MIVIPNHEKVGALASVRTVSGCALERPQTSFKHWNIRESVVVIVYARHLLKYK